MTDVVLGQLLKSRDGHRDAIHLAVVPMMAAANLQPGQRVGIVSEGSAGPVQPFVGIVDPFLTSFVPAGEVFWLCLFQGTVSGMRHHWSHPAFDQKSDEDRASAEAWLREQCEKLDVCFELITSKDSPLLNAGMIRSDDYSKAWSQENKWIEIEDEFWEQLAIYKGEPIPESKRGSFVCPC